eukprot:1345444-Amorphochlora_amoeboformis.AAC.1
MKPLKDTGKYWSGFEELPVFHQIQRIFRAAAYRYLRTVGISHRDAMLKSQSRTVVWASVHTGRSHHGPHNTEDSMVGGVFYVKVPKKAGYFALALTISMSTNSLTYAMDHSQ